MPENWSVAASDHESRRYGHKSNAITNLETRLEEFESLPHRHNALIRKDPSPPDPFVSSSSEILLREM
jgi:hypothetical protein